MTGEIPYILIPTLGGRPSHETEGGCGLLSSLIRLDEDGLKS